MRETRKTATDAEVPGRRLLGLLGAFLAVALLLGAMAPPQASALAQHLCGVYGTSVGPQESCPGISPRHSWKRVTGYRVQGGIDMCIVIRNANNNYLFSRCSFWATSMTIGPADMDYGKALTRAYNKNNNVTTGRETRYLYADTN
jgi:hypothetical protein